MAAPNTYWDYIKVESLLSLQTGIASSEEELSNDEVMFIVIHQIDELWFKLAIRELVSVRDLFATVPVPEQAIATAVRGVRRVQKLFHQAATHFELMETLTTRDYLSFRDKLSPASGFQSAQLREIEFLMGLSDGDRIPLGHESSYMQALRNPDGSESPASLRVARRQMDKPTLKDVLDDWLYRTPIQGSTPSQVDDADNVKNFLEAYLRAYVEQLQCARSYALSTAPTQADRERLDQRYSKEEELARGFLFALEIPEPERIRVSRIRAAIVFIESYRELPLLAWPREVLDAMVALEQSFVIFRQRHARMVERIIGRRPGTGGSAGVDYLDQTALRYRIFRDVWAVRTLLVQGRALPTLEQPEVYGFAEK